MDEATRDLADSGQALSGLCDALPTSTLDVREAPALALIRALCAEGARVRAMDPAASETAGRQLAELGDSVEILEREYACLEGADALFVMTEWNAFRRPDFARMREALAQPVLFDGRNLYDPARMAEMGFTYHGVGR